MRSRASPYDGGARVPEIASMGTLVGMTEPHPDDPVEVLRRWESSGAVWHVLARQGDSVTVGLFTCDGGEAVSQFTSRDPVLLRFLAAREP